MFMFKGSKGERPHLVHEKMLLSSFQTVCDGAERAGSGKSEQRDKLLRTRLRTGFS